MRKKLIYLYPSYEAIIADIAKLFCFEYEQVSSTINNKGCLQYGYTISDMSYARKSDVDNYIKNGSVGSSDYARASVLYALYACGYLTITDIQYPTYDDWKNKNNLTLDHSLPIRWFPNLTFDCTNWKPMSIIENKKKGDDFLNEGKERLQLLSIQIKKIKSKYL